MRTSNYTDFRKNLKKHLDSVISDNDPLVINRTDNSAVVEILWSNAAGGRWKRSSP